ERILPAREHARQPIQRALHVRPPHGFVQGGDQVEMLLAGLVVARERPLQHGDDVGPPEGERGAGSGPHTLQDRLQRVQRPASIALCIHDQGVSRLIGEYRSPLPAPGLVERPLDHHTDVFVFEPLKDEHIRMVIERALDKTGSGERGAVLSDEARDALVVYAQGDARRALNALEAVLQRVGTAPRSPLPLGRAEVVAVLERPLPSYDKSGEQHFNLISALHKAVRGSDVEGSLYWLARMLAGGEDPLYIARRLVRIAAEDVGLADPRALALALAAKDAYHFLGSPEGELALAEIAVYLATAPKSNRVYAAFAQAMDAAAEHPAAAVPLHIRNAPTKLMEELGYGAGYKYAHTFEHAFVPQEYLPEALRGQRWYEPTEFGFERDIKKRMEWWAELKHKATGGAMTDETATDGEATR